MPNTLDPHYYLKAILARDFKSLPRPSRRESASEPLVITVSRDYGAGGGDIARQLADCLSIPVYDQEILDQVAKRAKIPSYHFKPHDENVAAGLSIFVHSLLTGTGGHLETYRRYLYEVILDMALHDCILIGRGAHLILKEKNCFRLRIVGSRDNCAERISRQFDISLQEAKQEVNEINDKRHKSILRIFGDDLPHVSLNHAANFDLILNTDHYSPESALPVILVALQQAGFNLEHNGVTP